MIYIPLTEGEFAVVDEDDYDKVKDFSWRLSNWGYAFRGGGTAFAYMHRLVMGLSYKDGKSVDHINGNKLDNRKSNLRLCNQVQNNGNQKKPVSNTSGYKGVCWHKNDKRWYSRVQYEGKRIDLGYFDSAEDAAKAYNEKALELFGEFANLNDV